MGILSVRSVSYSYAPSGRRGSDSGADVLHDLSLDVPPERITAILGPNGVGKTTLLNICLGWLRARSGEVFFGDRPLSDFTRRELGRHISLVPQTEYTPFEYSLLEFVLLGRAPYLGSLQSPGREDTEIAISMLDRVGMADRAYESILATSAGEKQLVMLARSLTQEPSLLLLDEPSAHLDLANKRRLIELLRAEVDRGMTVLLTAHEPEFAAAIASHVVLMRNGLVTNAGSVHDVMTEENLSATYQLPISVHHVADRLSFHW